MRKNFLMLACAGLALLIAGPAFAGGNELMYKKITELPTLAGGSIDPAADYVVVYDASTGLTKKTLATSGAGTSTTSSSAELDYNDITTLGTLQASKVWTSDASLDTIMPTGGLLTVQSGGAITAASGSTVTVAGTFAISGTAAHTAGITGDGGDTVVGFKQSQIASTSTSLTIAQCGATVVSNSADVIVLPEASTALGCRYTFVCGTADDFDIDPADGTDAIGPVSTTNGTTAVVTLAPSAGDEIRCTDIGGSITLEAIAADLWAQVGGGNGVWTDVN